MTENKQIKQVLQRKISMRNKQEDRKNKDWLPKKKKIMTETLQPR